MTPEELAAEKTAKEIIKLDVEIRQANKLFRLEIFKAVAAVLGPLMTGLTVIGAVWVGLSQITAKSQSDEDALWRETVKAIDATPAADIAKTHFATFLKPFLLNSPRYRSLAIDVTLDELPNIHDERTFTDLFDAAFSDADLVSLSRLLSLERKLSDQAAALYPSNPSDPIPSEFGQITRLSAVVCEPVGNILRKYDHVLIKSKFFGSKKAGESRSSGQKIPMNFIYFQSCDFSGIDFSDIDLTASVFLHVKIDGATFVGVGDDPHLWDAQTWWRAKYIEASLLANLLKKYKPNQFVDNYAQEYRDSEKIKESEWDDNIMRLCRAAGLTCTDEMIKADFSR